MGHHYFAISPALVFLAFNWNSPSSIDGWAIPAATDIAFALGILSLLGPRVPVALKALLLAVAVIDDIGAITIIALFYSGEIQLDMLLGAGFALLILADLVVLDADPSQNIRNSDKVDQVMIGGRLFDASTMNEVATGDAERMPYFWED